MSILHELRRSRRIYAACPNCCEDFPLSAADLFDATKPLAGPGLEYLRFLETQLEEEAAAFEMKKKRSEERSRLGAQHVGIGKMVEKIAPSLPGFPLHPRDCRSLLEPIDYLAFPGLTATGEVEALVFVDVKSGEARLSNVQRVVRHAVEAGRLSFVLTNVPGEER